jgi:hypothetical protein
MKSFPYFSPTMSKPDITGVSLRCFSSLNFSETSSWDGIQNPANVPVPSLISTVPIAPEKDKAVVDQATHVPDNHPSEANVPTGSTGMFSPSLRV